MGNQDSRQEALNNFDSREWTEIVVPSKFKRTLLVNNMDPNLFVEKNIFQVGNKDHYGLARQLYQLRYRSRWLVQNQYLSIQNVDNACSKSQIGYLYTERIDLRLSEIYNIPYPDILHVYYQCFEGYQQLMFKLGCFRIDDDCIGINEDLVAKVWHSNNFAQLLPSMPIRTQQQMVQTIINVVEAHTDIRTMPPKQPSFGEFLYRHHGQRIGFNEAKKYLRQYSYLYNRGTIPDHLGHLAFDDPYQKSLPPPPLPVLLAPLRDNSPPPLQAPRRPAGRYNFLDNAVDSRYPVIHQRPANYQPYQPLPPPVYPRRKRRQYNQDLHPTLNSKIRRPPAQTTHTVYQPIQTNIVQNVIVPQPTAPTVVRSHSPIVSRTIIPKVPIAPHPVVTRPAIANPPVLNHPVIVNRPHINFSFRPETSIVRPVVPVPPPICVVPLTGSQTVLSSSQIKKPILQPASPVNHIQKTLTSNLEKPQFINVGKNENQNPNQPASINQPLPPQNQRLVQPASQNIVQNPGQTSTQNPVQPVIRQQSYNQQSPLLRQGSVNQPTPTIVQRKSINQPVLQSSVTQSKANDALLNSNKPNSNFSTQVTYIKSSFQPTQSFRNPQSNPITADVQYKNVSK